MVLISDSEMTACLGPLFRFAMTLTRDEDQARDLVQDCAERCLKKQHLFDGENLRAWMFTVCRRLFLNQRATAASRGAQLPMSDAMEQHVAVAPAQQSTLYFRDVADGVGTLPRDDQRLLNMIAVDGMRYQDAAGALDVPVGTIRSRLSRARTRLRASLGEEAVMAAA